MADKQRILIFEPDDDIREWIAAALACGGYYVWKTDTPMMAVAVIDEHSPDMIVMDYQRHLTRQLPEFVTLFDKMKHIPQFWLLDENALSDLKMNLPNSTETYPFDLMRKERLTELDRLKLREMTDLYRRCE